jgi:hypothetical protein
MIIKLHATLGNRCASIRHSAHLPQLLGFRVQTRPCALIIPAFELRRNLVALHTCCTASEFRVLAFVVVEKILCFLGYLYVSVGDELVRTDRQLKNPLNVSG